MGTMRPSVLNLETNDEISGFGVPSFVEIDHQAFWSHYDKDQIEVLKTDFRGLAAQRVRFEVGLGSSPGDVSHREPMDLGPVVEKLRRCGMPRADGSPPPCVLSFGSPLDLIVVFDSIRVKYSRFRADGRPIGARVFVEATELRDNTRRQQVATKPGPARGQAPSISAPTAIATALVQPGLAEASSEVKRQLQSAQDQVAGAIEDLRRRVETTRDGLAQRSSAFVNDPVFAELRSGVTAWKAKMEDFARSCHRECGGCLELVRQFKGTLADLIAREKARVKVLETQKVDDGLINGLTGAVATLAELHEQLDKEVHSRVPLLEKAAQRLGVDTRQVQPRINEAIDQFDKEFDSALSRMKASVGKLNASIRVTAIESLNAAIERRDAALENMNEAIENAAGEKLKAVLAKRDAAVPNAGRKPRDLKAEQRDLQAAVTAEEQALDSLIENLQAAVAAEEQALDKLSQGLSRLGDETLSLLSQFSTAADSAIEQARGAEGELRREAEIFRQRLLASALQGSPALNGMVEDECKKLEAIFARPLSTVGSIAKSVEFWGSHVKECWK